MKGLRKVGLLGAGNGRLDCAHLRGNGNWLLSACGSGIGYDDCDVGQHHGRKPEDQVADAGHKDGEDKADRTRAHGDHVLHHPRVAVCLRRKLEGGSGLHWLLASRAHRGSSFIEYNIGNPPTMPRCGICVKLLFQKLR